MSRADDEHLGRDHAAFLSAVFGRTAGRDDDEGGPAYATPAEVAHRLRRPRERELTRHDVAAFRPTREDDDDTDAREATSATPDDVADFFATLRRRKRR